MTVKSHKDKKTLMLEQARAGKLGTPERPDRSNSLHARFWEGYFGKRKASEFHKNTPARACVEAGVEYRRGGAS